jgi:hypothetical protein
MSYKIGEAFTDTIVEEVCKEIDCFGIVLTDESDYDFNYHKEKDNPYKQEIKKIVEENNIKYFLDIHGLKDHKQYDIEIYYPTKFSKSIRLARSIKEGINKYTLKGANILILRFPETPQEELGEYVASKLRVPSVQIEIARYIREREDLRNSLIENLSNTLETLAI